MYLYIINYPQEEKDLCRLEIKRLFNQELSQVIISNINYDCSRSVYFKHKLDLIVKDVDLNQLQKQLSTISVEKFRIVYVKLKQDLLTYHERMSFVSSVASGINGIGCLDEDATQIGIVYDGNYYYVGYLYEDHQTWQQYQNKPQSYSQSLSARNARSLVNIATGGQDIKIVDPCCGVGTVLLEALAMKHHIDGYEIHRGVAWKGNRNLEYFGYPKIIQNQDMHTISQHYDVAILDIPYNLYSKITKEEQFSLIQTCSKIADTLVLISYEDLSDMLIKNNFEIVDVCQITKIKMNRYVYYCEKLSLV